MLSRRSLFPALAAATGSVPALVAAAISVPTLALAGDYTPVPDVYLARSEPWFTGPSASPSTPNTAWKETWLHSVDSTWRRTLIASPELSPYAQRHAMMLELYKEDHRR